MDEYQIIKYLERIGLEKDTAKVRPDFELIKKLQYAHVTHVPYENLDIMSNTPLRLDEYSLYKKIVENSRGGYCFELNALYNSLLVALGYKTINCFARYLRGEDKIPMRRHRIMIAESPYTNGRIFTDIGIGERAPRFALRLEENTVQEQFSEKYCFKKEPFFGWVLYDFHNGSWNKFMSFTEEPQIEEDYIGSSYYCEASPDSVFRQGNMVSLKTETGRMTIAGNAFRIFDNDKVTETQISDKEHLNAILKEYFNISLNK